jgi:hypothetical protein
MQGHRTVSRKVPAAGAAAGDHTLEAASKRADAEAADAEDGGDGSANTASVLDVPEDWVDAAKRRQAEEEEIKRREQEAADLVEQEKRLAAAEIKRDADDKLFEEQVRHGLSMCRLGPS